MEKKKISELFDFLPKSKIKASEGQDTGEYVFYTCSDALSKYINVANFEPNKLIFGTGGSPSLHYAKEPFSTSTDCFVLSPKTSFNCKFVYYFLRQNWHILEQGFKGAGLKHISKEYISNIEIPVPSMEEQEAIVAKLDKANEIRDKKIKANEKLDELIKSQFIHLFGDPIKNEKKFNIESLSKFYDSTDSIKCGPFGSALKKHEYTCSGIIVWNMDNILPNSKFDATPHLHITQSKYNELKKYNVKNNDIIISRAGTVGKMCVVKNIEEPSIISTNLVRLRVDNTSINPFWFVKLIEINGNKICRLKTGNEDAFTHMNTGILNNIYFPYPPIDEQNQFAQFVEKVEEQKSKNEIVIQKMTNLINSIMQQEFES